MSVFYSANFNSVLKSAYDVRQKPDRSWENTHNMIEMSRRNYELNKCVFKLLLKVSMDRAHLMEMGSVFQREGAACAKQRLPKPSRR